MALLNSRPHAVPVIPDTLNDPQGVRTLLDTFGRHDAELPGPEELELVRMLRTDLMNVLTAEDHETEARGWKDLTAHAAEITFRQDFSPGGAQLRQVTGEPLAGEAAAAVAELVRSGGWSRVRVCGNHRCSRVFYDTTRSRTQRWHSYEVCGNRSNVAAYRARKGASRTTEPTA
jgi:predicted RNA-binding Zn ribbon-like protein